MKSRDSLYNRRRFPPEIIRHAVWLYYRFCFSYRDVEDLLSERGIRVSYESIRRWCIRFGPIYANRLRKRSGPGGDQWFVDEVFVRIGGQLRYLYRAVDQDGQSWMSSSRHDETGKPLPASFAGFLSSRAKRPGD
jgi:putative transposase